MKKIRESAACLDCEKCESLVNSRSRVVYGYGDINSEVMFVGLAPGRNGADITGVPFTRDPSGILFQEAMIEGGFSLEKDPRIETPRLNGVYITNLVKCNPRDSSGRNRAPSKDEITNCFPHFRNELHIINPKIVVTLGRIVTEYVVRCEIIRLSDIHNHPFSRGGRTYIPFFHPSYVIRGAYNRAKYIEEIAGIKRLSRLHRT